MTVKITEAHRDEAAKLLGWRDYAYMKAMKIFAWHETHVDNVATALTKRDELMLRMMTEANAEEMNAKRWTDSLQAIEDHLHSVGLLEG